ncbi:hypothetical protein CNYM01_02061 [Colletotrichum nymphaeae SA-01]|uniref:Uncharacterized protein n=1 Tax=Colletotrichum nymphaeae SA-01 TaxID=1460502 RepID=A0A135UWR1_9PEZI|nr:hypothetical protein CNYM01_02061 [Colletotrichum nymphaeae SA-01]
MIPQLPRPVSQHPTLLSASPQASVFGRQIHNTFELETNRVNMENKVNPTMESISSQMDTEGKSREEMIAESVEKNEDVQNLYPQVDFKGAVLEPTIHLTYDIQEHVDEPNQRRYNTLIAEMLERTAEPDLAERLLWEARECLTGYQDILAQFDAIFLGQRSASSVIRELHECMMMKKTVERRMSQQVDDVENGDTSR